MVAPLLAEVVDTALMLRSRGGKLFLQPPHGFVLAERMGHFECEAWHGGRRQGSGFRIAAPPRMARYPILAFNSLSKRMPRPISSFCRAGLLGYLSLDGQRAGVAEIGKRAEEGLHADFALA